MTVNEKGLEAALAIPLKGRFWPGENAMESEDSNWLYYKRERYSQIIEAYLRAASKDAEPVAWQYRYWYSSGEPGVWLSERRKDADDLLESGVLIREETRALFTFQPDALVHVDGVTMTPTAAANRIAELSAAQADHSTAIEPVAASPGVGAVNDGEIRLDEGALKAAMAAKPWPAREYTVALLMEQGGCGTETLSAAIRAYLAAAPTSPAPSPSTEDVMGAMSWALGEIDVLSNKLCGFAYPQGMGMLGRRSAAQEDAYENAVKVRALSSKQRSGE